MRTINKVKLYVKDNEKAHNVEKIIKNALEKHNFELNDDFDLEMAVGGDGTFLKMLHHSNFIDKYYASVNAGSLGFFSSVDLNNIDSFIQDLDNNNYQVREINILKVKIYLNNNAKEFYCVNEFTIRNTNFSTFKADVLVNDRLLEKFNGDGLVISTPVGSTGYNLGLFGSVIDNDLKAYSITPIAPINNKVYKSLINPLILSGDKKLTIVPSNNPNLCYLCDGKIEKINSCDKIECFLEKRVKCIVTNDYDYIDVVKNKMIDIKE